MTTFEVTATHLNGKTSTATRYESIDDFQRMLDSVLSSIGDKTRLVQTDAHAWRITWNDGNNCYVVKEVA